MTIFTDRAKVLPFCSPPENETTDVWKTYEPRELVRRDICPAWLLPSDNVLGRCIPKPSNSNHLSLIKFIYGSLPKPQEIKFLPKIIKDDK